MINIVVAVAKNGAISKEGKMPWNLPKEFQFFLSIIKGGTVIVGRKTWEEIKNPDYLSKKYIVVSKTLKSLDHATVCKTFTEAINLAKTFKRDIHICGGTKIYEEALKIADKLLISYIKKDYEGDTFFPKFNKEEWEIERTEDHDEFEFVVYKRKIKK